MSKSIIGRRKLPFPFDLFLRWNGPVYYTVKCKKCGWGKIYHVFSGTTCNASDTVTVENVVKTKNELPTNCPTCGAKVKKYRLPDFSRE